MARAGDCGGGGECTCSLCNPPTEGESSCIGAAWLVGPRMTKEEDAHDYDEQMLLQRRRPSPSPSVALGQEEASQVWGTSGILRGGRAWGQRRLWRLPRTCEHGNCCVSVVVNRCESETLSFAFASRQRTGLVLLAGAGEGATEIRWLVVVRAVCVCVGWSWRKRNRRAAGPSRRAKRTQQMNTAGLAATRAAECCCCVSVQSADAIGSTHSPWQRRRPWLLGRLAAATGYHDDEPSPSAIRLRAFG